MTRPELCNNAPLLEEIARHLVEGPVIDPSTYQPIKSETGQGPWIDKLQSRR